MILDEIVANKKREIETAKQRMPLSKVESLVRKQGPAKDIAVALKGDRVRLIAEVKKASPSKGLICPDFDPVKIARTYAANGAAAISVLTESRYFQGNLDDLRSIGQSLGESRPPLLRKDFIFDPYQVYEARAFGADAILLIVAILAPEQLHEMVILSHSLGMEPLVEVHNDTEAMIAAGSHARVIGINNRDLRTFSVDITTTERLRRLVPQNKIIVSESGIKSRADMGKMKDWGVDAVLIGEALMTAQDIAAKMRELL